MTGPADLSLLLRVLDRSGEPVVALLRWASILPGSGLGTAVWLDAAFMVSGDERRSGWEERFAAQRVDWRPRAVVSSG